jgi:hypothetical protein
LAPTLILVLVMAEALLICYAGAVALALIALPVLGFALRRSWKGRR